MAHRVVHGGEKFTEATLITDEVLAQIETLNPLAPLHNPGERRRHSRDAATVSRRAARGRVRHCVSSHAAGLRISLRTAVRALRKESGASLRFSRHVAQLRCLRAAEFLKRRPNELRMVSCHLGNGSSLCAVDHGRSVDTTMGFTPLEGLIMGTRCGDLDAGVLAFLEREEKLTASQERRVAEQEERLAGLVRRFERHARSSQAADQGHHRALLALKAYCYRVRKYIGAYVASMGGLDTVIFTGGVGQGSAEVRALALQGLECMGITLDDKRNRDARG